MIVNEVIKGKLISVEDNSYIIQDENGQEFPNCINITSLKLKVGELVYIFFFEDSKQPIIAGTLESNVRDRTIEDLVNENKNNINNLKIANLDLSSENKKILRLIDGNKKFIQEIENKMIKDSEKNVSLQDVLDLISNNSIKSKAIADLNNAIETGFYNCYSADNAPSTGFYTIEVNTDGANVIQRATNANRITYQRIGYDVQNDPSWSEWTGGGISQAIIDQIKAEVKAEIFEEEHEIGDLFYTTKVDVNPNNKYPNMVWERWPANYYIVSAGDGINGKQEVGTNSYTLTTSQLPQHNHSGSISSVSLTTNSHSHKHAPGSPSTEFIGKSATGNLKGLSTITGGSFQYYSPDYTTSESHTHTINAHGHTLTINNNGSGASIDNRPRSYGVYIWERMA